MKLLLTGASGFFGSNLVDLLAAPHRSPEVSAGNGDDIEVHSMVRSPGPARSGVLEHQIDLFDDAAIDRLLTEVRPTHLCHLAWLGPEHEDRYRSPANRAWAAASKRLFEAFRRHGGRRLVQVGSCIEYGNTRSGLRSETHPLTPDTAYGEAKAELSSFVATLADDLSVAVARPFFGYGRHEQPERLVPSLILALHRGERIDLTEGRQRRDYLDARDIAAALLTLLCGEATGAFNIGSGVATEVRAIAEHLGRIAGRPDLLNFGARPEGADTAAEIVADIGAITSATPWKPTISLERGLEETTAWWLGRIADGGPSRGDQR